MKHLKFIIMALALTMFNSCADDKNEPEGGGSTDDVTVTISTEILTKADVTTIFGEGDAMNVYPKTYGKINAPNRVDNVKATQTGGAWTLSPEVKISKGQNAFIYAVAPYNSAYTDASAIPVDISQQIDLLYSGSYVPVSYTTHNAKLVMKHALSLVSFNISAQGYSGAGKLTQMKISGEKVYTKGTMSADNGKILGTSQDDFTLSVNKTITEAGWSEDLPRMWQIPFATKISVANLTLTIDGKQYNTAFPEVEMKSGFQYIFRMVLTDYGIEFIPGEVETISLNQKEDSMGALSGYGVLSITHIGSDLTAPTFLGDNVFGTITWGDGTSSSYKPMTTHTYSVTGEKEVVIESWNSTGFELENLTGIETIDLTAY